MTFDESINIKLISFVLTVAVVSGILWLGSPQAAYADRVVRNSKGSGEGHGGKHGGGMYLDTRHGHHKHYPARGGFINALPKDHRVVIHRNDRYYFHGGAWYRPSGPRFTVIAPPIGLVVPFLPSYYASIWVRGYPYYYADEVYYAPTVGGYMVVAPPQGSVSQTPSPSSSTTAGERMFIYPRNGQNEQQQADDRYQCHRWAVDQTNYDPTQPPEGIPSSGKNADYLRAMSACLDARGYTVK